MTRKEKILSNIHPATQRGIEIGALHQPIVTRDMGSICYVDHASTEELRAKCAPWGTVDISKIVEVDYVWGGKNLRELTSKECPFDYAIASHVIEHVPDFIGWLKEIRSILKTGGILSLAIPDKRFTFDYFRQLSKPSDVIEAYFRQAKKPSLRQIFDYHSEFVRRNGDFSWGVYGLKNELIHEHSIEKALEITQRAFQDDQYVDVHCWVFTELSFIKLLKVLAQLNLIDYKINHFFQRTVSEFFIGLEAVDLNLDVDKRNKIQLESFIAFEKKAESLLRQPIFDYTSWKVIHGLKVLNGLRAIKRKFLH